MTCWFMPSLISGDNQTLLSWGEASVLLNSAGQLCARIGDELLLTGAETVRLRRWYHCTLRISADGALRLMLADGADQNPVNDITTGTTGPEALAALLGDGALYASVRVSVRDANVSMAK